MSKKAKAEQEQQQPPPPPPDPDLAPAGFRKELRSVKHIFTPQERGFIGDELARQIAALRAIEAEFDEIKAGFKARTAAAEAQIQSHAHSLTSGYDFRNKLCYVFFDAPQRTRYAILESTIDQRGINPAVVTPIYLRSHDLPEVAIEPMEPLDFQTELPIGEAQAEDNDSGQAGDSGTPFGKDDL